MSKTGQHKGDSFDQTRSKGPNNPSKSVTITTGSVKKQETYEKQAAEHRATNRPAQAAKNEWNADTRDQPSIAGSTRARNPRSGRSGSDSNASRRTRG